MFTFTPLDYENATIANVDVTLEQLHELQVTLKTALNANPATTEFTRVMEGTCAILGSEVYDPWLLALKKIRTEGERDNIINFIFEDWISTWRIADFIDRAWTVAEISSEWHAPRASECKNAEII